MLQSFLFLTAPPISGREALLAIKRFSFEGLSLLKGLRASLLSFFCKVGFSSAMSCLGRGEGVGVGDDEIFVRVREPISAEEGEEGTGARCGEDERGVMGLAGDDEECARGEEGVAGMKNDDEEEDVVDE